MPMQSILLLPCRQCKRPISLPQSAATIWRFIIYATAWELHLAQNRVYRFSLLLFFFLCAETIRNSFQSTTIQGLLQKKKKTTNTTNHPTPHTVLVYGFHYINNDIEEKKIEKNFRKIKNKI